MDFEKPIHRSGRLVQSMTDLTRIDCLSSSSFVSSFSSANSSSSASAGRIKNNDVPSTYVTC